MLSKKINYVDTFILFQIYHGYCDDYRNTDNAWVETVAYNFHDEDGKVFKNIFFSVSNLAVKFNHTIAHLGRKAGQR